MCHRERKTVTTCGTCCRKPRNMYSINICSSLKTTTSHILSKFVYRTNKSPVMADIRLRWLDISYGLWHCINSRLLRLVRYLLACTKLKWQVCCCICLQYLGLDSSLALSWRRVTSYYCGRGSWSGCWKLSTCTAATMFHFSTRCIWYRVMRAHGFTTSTITTSLAITHQRLSGGTNCLELTASILTTARKDKSPKSSDCIPNANC